MAGALGLSTRAGLRLGIAALTKGVRGKPAYLFANSRLVLHNGRQQATVSALQNSYAYITMISPPWDCKAPRFCWAGFYGQTGQGELAVGNDVTIEGALIEIAGTKTPLTFSGASSGTVPNGSHLWSDPDDSIVLPANTVFRFGAADTVGANQYRPSSGHQMLPASIIGTADSPSRGDRNSQGSSSQLTNMQNNVAGNVTLINTPLIGGPIMMIAKPLSTAAKAVLIVGDSIGWSLNQFNAPYAIRASEYGAMGFIMKALNDDENGRIPWANLCVPGSRDRDVVIGGSGAAGENGFTMRAAALAAVGYPYTAVINQHGINTVANANATVSVDNATTAYAALKGYGNRKVLKTTLTPQTTATNDPGGTLNRWNWATDDATKQQKASDGSHVALDAFIAGVPTNVDAIIDIRPALESSSGSRKWKGPSTDGYSGTLAAAVSSGTTISLNTACEPGSHLMIDPGDASLFEAVRVTTVTGTGPYTATVASAITKSHASGAAVVEQPSDDGTHITRLSANRAKVPVVAAKPQIPTLAQM